MKISNSKKQLAKIISENGGWREGAGFAAQDSDGDIFFYKTEPTRVGRVWRHNGVLGGDWIECDNLLSNWHQTILSCDEYSHLYPAPVCGKRWGHVYAAPPPEFSTSDKSANAGADGWGNLGSSVARYIRPEYGRINTGTFGKKPEPTIEQLAAEYRNRQDYAERKQQEADAARGEAEAKLAELVAAGKAVGLVVGVAVPEPELVITDIDGLIEGDVIELTAGERYNKTECTMVHIDGVGLRAKSASDTMNKWWNLDGPQDYEWRFLRRPAKEADNA